MKHDHLSVQKFQGSPGAKPIHNSKWINAALTGVSWLSRARHALSSAYDGLKEDQVKRLRFDSELGVKFSALGSNSAVDLIMS